LVCYVGCQQYNVYCHANSSVPLNPIPQGFNLSLVLLFTRHGDRTPVFSTPIEDDYSWECKRATLLGIDKRNENSETVSVNRLFRKNWIRDRNGLLGNCALGQLTTIGEKQHNELGRNLRERYVNYLNYLKPNFDYKSIYIRSSDFPRTLESAQSLLKGFFPPEMKNLNKKLEEFSNEKEEIGYEIEQFPINVISQPYETLIANPSACPQYTNVFNNWLKNESSYIQSRFGTLLNEMENLFNNSDVTFNAFLANDFLCRVCHNVSLPQGMTSDIMEQLFELTEWWFSNSWTIGNTQFLGMGPLLMDLQEILMELVEGSIPFKFIYFSAHDTTLGPLLTAIGNTQYHVPPYASHAEFEIYQEISTLDYYISITFNGNQLVLPACNSTMCLLDDWMDYFSQNVPNSMQEWQQECTSSFSSSSSIYPFYPFYPFMSSNNEYVNFMSLAKLFDFI